MEVVGDPTRAVFEAGACEVRVNIRWMGLCERMGREKFATASPGNSGKICLFLGKHLHLIPYFDFKEKGPFYLKGGHNIVILQC